MPTFTYHGYTADGKSRRGRLEGLNAKDIREKLMEQGVYAREVVDVSVREKRGGLNRNTRGMLYRELSALLQAGLPLDRALEILSETPVFARAGQLPSVLRDRVREGVPFSRAFASLATEVSGTEEAVLAAGESSGRLVAVTGELADTLEEESALADQIRAALLYPLVVTLLAFGVLGVMVGFLLPMYEELLTGMNRELPSLTRWVLAAGRALRHPVGLLGIVVAVSGCLMGVARFRRDPEAFLPRRRFSLPVLGPMWSSLTRTRFCRTLALLLEGGVQLPEAIGQAARSTGSSWVVHGCREIADRVSQGERFAVALESQPVLGEDLPGWVRAGEASGDLVSLLRHAARSHQRAWSRGLGRTLSLMEPLLIIAVGAIILLVALAVLLPMLRINQGLA